MTTGVDPETGEVIERGIIPVGDVVRPLVTAEEAAEQWKQYLALCQAILASADYQKIAGKRFKKKSAWRKLARAFRISDRIIDYSIERDANHRPIFAAFTVEAEYPTGQIAVGYHEAHVRERCCLAAQGAQCAKRNWDDHQCCRPGCDGWPHWSHPGDVPATAHTRAKNRAIADLIGAGEVSAEEIGNGNGQARQVHRETPSTPKGKEDRERTALFGLAGKAWPDRDSHTVICQALNLPEVSDGALHRHWLERGGTYLSAQRFLAEVRRNEVQGKMLFAEAVEVVNAYGQLPPLEARGEVSEEMEPAQARLPDGAE